MPRSSKVLKFLCHSEISMYKNFSIHCKICLRAFKVPKITRFLALSGNSGVVAGIQRDEDLAFHLLVVSFLGNCLYLDVVSSRSECVVDVTVDSRQLEPSITRTSR